MKINYLGIEMEKLSKEQFEKDYYLYNNKDENKENSKVFNFLNNLLINLKKDGKINNKKFILNIIIDRYSGFYSGGKLILSFGYEIDDLKSFYINGDDLYSSLFWDGKVSKSSISKILNKNSKINNFIFPLNISLLKNFDYFKKEYFLSGKNKNFLDTIYKLIKNYE